MLGSSAFSSSSLSVTPGRIESHVQRIFIADNTCFAGEFLIRDSAGKLGALDILDIAHQLKALNTLVYNQLCEIESMMNHGIIQSELNGRVFINIPMSFLRECLSELLEFASTMKKSAVTPVVEINENDNIVVSDAPLFDKLRKLGVEVAADDFSFSDNDFQKMTMLEFDYIKFDKQVITDIELDTRTLYKIKSLALSPAKFIAEGVENLEQYTFLKSCNIFHLWQGFLMHKPEKLTSKPAPLLQLSS